MKEPTMYHLQIGAVPFSQVPSDVLARLDSIQHRDGPKDPNDQDQDFRRRFAAIILKERGR